MQELTVHPSDKLGYGFIPAQYLPPGQDEYYVRNQQSPASAQGVRPLRAEEIQVLVGNGNSCDAWDQLLVSDPFTPQLIRNCEFFGLVRLGRLERVVLEHHDLTVPAGITDSLVMACDLGDNVAIHHVRYLAHYILGNHVILWNVDEMNMTNRAKFGNGILREGEAEEARIWLDLMNEAGGRSVMPFDGMLPADAYLWAKYRDDPQLLQQLGRLTQAQFGTRRGCYGTIGDECVIKNTRSLKDVKIGPHCYIKGANKLKNLTINSSAEEPSQIGEGVELVNGIIARGCHVFYGCKAVRFIMGHNSRLKYGARLIHSFLGDNSTVSCCEILNNLIFPAHEQHHNNSFLIASLVMGQSNIAAGATIGSNHNSRANDGEIQAGRGFWPGLCATLKHNSRFASFVLLAKGDYPAELDIPLPFSLVSDDVAGHRLHVLPAYWWLYNMYALARNTWKFQARDQRRSPAQHIEYDCLAPDTAEEIFRALELLERWTAQAFLATHGGSAPGRDDHGLLRLGRELLRAAEDQLAGLEILGERLENSRRKTVLLKVRQGYQAYRQMLHHYAVRNLLAYLQTRPQATLDSMSGDLAGARERSWVNLGGQLVPAREVGELQAGIKTGRLNSWAMIHQDYDRLWTGYPLEKQRHAYATLLTLLDAERLSPALWDLALDEGVRIQEYVRDQVFRSRKRDYDDPFRRITYRNTAEMQAVLGSPEDNSFVQQVGRETDVFREQAAALRRLAND